MCQGCVDDGRVPQYLFDVIELYLSSNPESEFGNAHIVLADLNLEDHHIKWCLEQELNETDREFLLTLLEIPEKERLGG